MFLRLHRLRPQFTGKENWLHLKAFYVISVRVKNCLQYFQLSKSNLQHLMVLLMLVKNYFYPFTYKSITIIWVIYITKHTLRQFLVNQYKGNLSCHATSYSTHQQPRENIESESCLSSSAEGVWLHDRKYDALNPGMGMKDG